MNVKRVYQQLKNIYHFFQAHGWRWWYGRPDKVMKIYGVTGTNGKTTTSILVGTMLREAYGREKVGLVSTIVFWVGGREKVNETKMTTMKSREVFELLREMKDQGVEQVVMEITSHALDQHRLAGIELNGAIILNIAREHLDYHGTMPEYAKAKSKIVSYIKEGGVLVYKADDEWIEKEIRENPNVKIQMSKLHILSVGFTKQEAVEVSTPLAGDWNKENVLAARLLAKNIGIEERLIQQAIEKVRQVPGRMEWIGLKSQITNSKSQINSKFQSTKTLNLPKVLIDYAVTSDALERLYKEVRITTTGRIFGVLGACGERDRGKRPEMARVVAKYADELVLTREDPWTEDEEQIFNDLEKGLEQNTDFRQGYGRQAKHKTQSSNKTPTFAKAMVGRQNIKREILQTSPKLLAWRRIIDRREAIKYCIEKAGPEDVVVVTGKGAETGMAIGKEVIPWSDREVIQELLQQKVEAIVKRKAQNEK